MAGLEGTIKTPLGVVQKKTALILGGGAVVLGGIVWYRQKQLAATTVTPTEGEINPATGYPYGSPEDAAALQAQTSYVSPPAPTGGSTTYPTTGYTSNSQWVQAVIEYMTGNNTVTDATQLSAALGKFITGAYVTDAEVSLIQQAIAVQDFPPISGPNGYPPSLNRTNPNNTTTTSLGKPTVKLFNTRPDHITLQWNGIPSAVSYQVEHHVYGASPVNSVTNSATTTQYVVGGLRSKTKYQMSVRAVDGRGNFGPWSNAIRGVTT
jgi:hypothetical protein